MLCYRVELTLFSEAKALIRQFRFQGQGYLVSGLTESLFHYQSNPVYKSVLKSVFNLNRYQIIQKKFHQLDSLSIEGGGIEDSC